MSVSSAKLLPSNRKANKADVAEWFGVSVVAVDGWIRRGVPYVQKGAKGLPWVFDLRDVAEWRFGSGTSSHDGPKNPEEMEPRDRKDWYEGESKRIAIERESGQLRHIDEFRAMLASILKTLAQVMETAQDTLEREHSIPPDVSERVQNAMDDLRGRMYNQLIALDEPKDEFYPSRKSDDQST
ncbi:MAG: DUF1441 family protein [Woeseia sp.]|nr:DUF1441 family protein [Woeseia sp.]